jgi:hypothetical protein
LLVVDELRIFIDSVGNQPASQKIQRG